MLDGQDKPGETTYTNHPNYICVCTKLLLYARGALHFGLVFKNARLTALRSVTVRNTFHGYNDS